MHLTISGTLLPSCLCQWGFFSHLKMKLACFECSFGRSLAPDADSEWSCLPRGPILPITHAEKRVLLQAVLATGGGAAFLGGVVRQASISQGVEVVLVPPEEDKSHCQGGLVPSRERGRTRGIQGSPQCQASPQCCWRNPRGLLYLRWWVSRRQWSACAWAGRLTKPSGFTFTSRLLFQGNIAVRRFTESEKTNSHEDNESPDYLMTA